jgi:NAD(P)-dependent dehydrogenase (short-subunit alcohol dehydrogenase family)
MTDQRRFADQVAVVTGAAAGIGAASAARLAAEGAITVLADIDRNGAAQQAARIVAAGGVAVAEHCDVGRLASWQELAGRVAAQFGRVDVIHNNAYTVERLAADALPESSWDRQIAVNLSSIYYCVQALLGLMTGPAPAIVNTASVHAMVGMPHYPAYAAAKGGIIALTRQLAVEYGPRIRVNGVAPGPILTQTWRDVPAAEIAAVARNTVAKRMGRPEDVAAAVAFLASADAAYITGTTLLVDGGYLATRTEGAT